MHTGIHNNAVPTSLLINVISPVLLSGDACTYEDKLDMELPVFISRTDIFLSSKVRLFSTINGHSNRHNTMV